MSNCEICGGRVPEVMKGGICPECLGIIIANSMVEDEDNDDFEPEDDEPEIKEEGDEPAKLEDGDIITSDYMKFYEYGRQHVGPVVECREGERWAHAVVAYMDDEEFWPNVWYIGERGDADLIDMYDALHSEEQ